MHSQETLGRRSLPALARGAVLAAGSALKSFSTDRVQPSAGAGSSAVATVAIEAPAPAEGRFRAFSALRHRDYRLLLAGVFFSLLGLWVFMTTQSWLALQLTDSNAWVSVVTSAESLPFLFVSLYAGVLADRVNRKRLMFATRSAIVVLMLVEAAIAATGRLEPYHLVVFALLAGVIFSLDLPTRQSLIADLVPPEDVANAVALQFSTFNLTMILGPAIGATLLATGGAAWAFVITAVGNGLLAVLVLLMRVPPPRHHGGVSALRQLKEGLNFVIHTPAVRWILTLALFVTTFGFAYQVLLPAFADDVFDAGEGGYGALAAMGGLGALLGSLAVAFLGQIRRRSPLLFAGPLCFSLALYLLAASPGLAVAALAVFLAGAAGSIYATMNNTIILTTVPEGLRGRVMSVSVLVWGLTPAGSLAAGIIADSFGVRVAVAVSAAVGLSATLIVFSTRRVMRSF